MTEKLYSMKDIAVITGIHINTVYRNFKSGSFEYVTIGKRKFMNQQQVDKMLGK